MYDYIIVGAGCSGCAMAYQLGKLLPTAKILLIEAGDDNDVPAIHDFKRTTETYKNYAWLESTEQQAKLNNRAIPYLSGCVIGGSGSINGMVCVIPSKHDDIMQFVENKDIQKVCHKIKPSDRLTSNSAISKSCMLSLVNMGFTYADNPFKLESADGAAYYSYLNVSKSGVRIDPYMAFLAKHKNQNLTILKNSKVTKVIIDSNFKATGVIVEKNGAVVTKETYFAKNEIILCAGATHTPIILMNSGIGPKKILQEANIPIIRDLPVGENLHDHMIVFSARPIKHPEGEAHLTSMDINAFFSRNNITLSPELKIEKLKRNPVADFEIQTFYLKDGWGDSIPKNSYVVGLIILHPKSRGVIKLHNDNGNLKKVIDPKCMTAESDVELIFFAQKAANAIADALPDDIFEKRILPPIASSDDSLLDYIKSNAVTDFHPGGTCSIDNVVDKAFSVKGVTNLRVADASIIPSPVTGNTQIIASAIGIRAAKLIYENRIKHTHISSENGSAPTIFFKQTIPATPVDSVKEKCISYTNSTTKENKN